MNNNPNFVIATFPSREIIQFINKLKERYTSKKYSTTISSPIKLHDSPHLTLKRKFTPKKITENQIIEKISKVVEKHKQIELETGKINLFGKPNKNTVYLEIKTNPNLKNLAEKIQKQLQPNTTTFEPKLDINFIPHITILWEISDSKLRQVQKIFSETTPNFKFKIDKLYLLKSSTKFEGKRELIYIFKLVGENQVRKKI